MIEILTRPAGEQDLPAILAIYNDAVTNTTAIWNETPSDLEGRREWWRARVDAGYPVLVAEKTGSCVGYATYGPFRPNEGYRHARELSLYVAASHRGHGIASQLMLALEEVARAQNVHVLVGGIEATNNASIQLHHKHGFVETGRMREVGRKFDRWLDLVLMQKILD